MYYCCCCDYFLLPETEPGLLSPSSYLLGAVLKAVRYRFYEHLGFCLIFTA